MNEQKFAPSAQPLSEKERNIVEEAYSRLAIWRAGDEEMHERAKEARQILLLQDPKQDAPNTKDRKRTIQLQTLKSTFNNCMADQMDNMPEAMMLPEREELVEVAEDMTDTVRYVMAANDYETVHRMRVEDFLATGTAITQIAWDESMDAGRGNVAVIRWPIEAFLWDPGAENLQDARALFKVCWHPMSWYEQHYPDVCKYISPDARASYGLATPKSQEIVSAEDEESALLLEYWYRLYDVKKKRYEINVAYLAGRALLSLHENVYSHGMYPFVADVYTRIEGLPVGDGLVQEIAPMMRYVNRYMAYTDMNLRMASKGRLLMRRDSGIDKETLADWSNDIIEGDKVAPEDVHWLQNAPFTGMITAQMLQLQTDIKQDSGQNQFVRGEVTGGVTSGSAISALQEAGGKIARLRTNALNQGFKKIVEQVMWLISQFYDKERVLYITGDRQRPHQVQASPEHLFGKRKGQALPPPPYSVQVQVQRRNPLRIQAQNDLYIQAYTMAAQSGAFFPLTTLFELLMVDGKDRIMPILRENDQTQQLIQGLQQQVEQLSQAMEGQNQQMNQLRMLNGKYSQALARSGAEVPDAAQATLSGLPPGVA